MILHDDIKGTITLNIKHIYIICLHIINLFSRLGKFNPKKKIIVLAINTKFLIDISYCYIYFNGKSDLLDMPPKFTPAQRSMSFAKYLLFFALVNHALAAGWARSNSHKIAFPSFVTTISVLKRKEMADKKSNHFTNIVRCSLQ